MSELFHCNVCSKYKPIKSKCLDLPCCEDCKDKVLAADVADKTEAVKKKKVISHALRVKQDLDDKMYQRELNSIENWMND
jgi:hypothetical protein